MFDLDQLISDIAPPTRKPAIPQETTSSTTKEVAGSLPASYPQEPATPDPLAGELRVTQVDAGNEPASPNAAQDEKNPDLAGLRVGSGIVADAWTRLLSQVEAPARDLDPTGCPTHWQRVPELPPKGATVQVVDRDGYGCLYRVKLFGGWYLVKFLPPFDGRCSLTDPQHHTRVFLALDEAYRWAWATEYLERLEGKGAVIL